MSDKLIVYLSGNPSDGDPEASIEINGQTVGSALDVSASYAADNVQAFAFTGDFGADPTVSVSMINQGPYDGSSPQRLLVLDGFSYDGVAQLNDKLDMNYDQTASYQLTSTPISAERAADITESLGVDAHLDLWNTSYGTAGGTAPNTALVASSLAFLGIDHVRVGIPTAQTLPEQQSLMADGVKFDVLLAENSSTSLLPQQIAALDPIASSISSIEGPNEVNITSGFSWNGQNTLAAAASYQKAIYQAVQADPALAGKPVLNLTLGGVGLSTYAGLGNLSADATYGNIHVYYPDGLPPASTLQYAETLGHASTPGDPLVITETNYPTDGAISPNVSDDVQAKYDLDLIMDATKDGIVSTYFYELLDEAADPTNSNIQLHYGLFNSDGTPKPAATAIHNLTTLLADPGTNASTFKTGALAYSISGLPASGNSLLLEKSNGAYDVVVWAEPVLWNVSSSSETAATARSVTVSFTSAHSEVKVFDPLAGTAAILEQSNSTSVTVSVTDHPLIIEVEPAVATPPPAVTIGSGPDILALKLSEDAFDGDARYVVLVDGKQVGTTMTETASHAAGLSQTVNVEGSFGPGTHTAGIDFLNDAYMPGVGDRNLYLDGATLNGAAIPHSSLTLRSTGTQTVYFLGEGVSPTVTIGSGPDTLALRIAEEAFQGDAQYTVAIDGKQYGGTLTATANQMTGDAQTVNLLGSFGTGSHVVEIDFLNDRYQPNVGDRNLYLDGATIDGRTIAGSELTFLSAGPKSMSFLGTTSAKMVASQTPAQACTQDATL
ncbi:MAG: carbohydrate-binding domain-containing protein, partial [Janthinobacterium lividum]